MAGILPTGRSDVGPDILAPLAGGDREAMCRIDDRVRLAAQEINRVAIIVDREAILAQGQDGCSNHYMVVGQSTYPSPMLYEDTEKD